MILSENHLCEHGGKRWVGEERVSAQAGNFYGAPGTMGW